MSRETGDVMRDATRTNGKNVLRKAGCLLGVEHRRLGAELTVLVGLGEPNDISPIAALPRAL